MATGSSPRPAKASWASGTEYRGNSLLACTIEGDTSFKSLSFPSSNEPGRGSHNYVLTERGLPGAFCSETRRRRHQRHQHRSGGHMGYSRTMRKNNQWITHRGENIIFLPPSHRLSSTWVQGRKVVLAVSRVRCSGTFGSSRNSATARLLL